jgi:hypothetical protein
LCERMAYPRRFKSRLAHGSQDQRVQTTDPTLSSAVVSDKERPQMAAK